MTYICRECGHEDYFNAEQEVTKWGTEEITIGNEGEITDWGDYETNDSEVTSEPDNITCGACDSSNVDDIDDEEELEEIRLEFERRGPGNVPATTNWREALAETKNDTD